MKHILFLILMTIINYGNAQEYQADLFEVKTENTLKSFRDSKQKKMYVKNYIPHNGKDLLEYSTVYKKTIFNSNIINFKITYSDNYIMNNYSKSIGKYVLKGNGLVETYQRTDFGGKKELILGTEYHNLQYTKDILSKDNIRYKEYYNVGSVEMDTASTFDYLNYTITSISDTITQTETSSGLKVHFISKNNLIIKESSKMDDYLSETEYTYNSSKQLIKKNTNLISNETKGVLRNFLKIAYNSEGLIILSEFYDQTNTLLERKVFSYK